jgi:uncharacterized protein (DUF697 family)/GTPase SAR1 family protein
MTAQKKRPGSGKRSSSQPDFDLSGFIKEFEKAYGEALKSLGRFNLVIFGDTGTGKSTLINAVFGDEVAMARAGRPVTQSTNYYEHPTGILGIYDTKGIETGRSEEQVLTDLDEIISSKRSLPLEEQIHVIWYCLSPSPPRWESAQARFVRELADEDIPILFVLTQVKKKPDGTISPEVQQVLDAIEEDALPTHPDGHVFQTLAKDDDWGGYKAHGLPELLDATFQVAPDGIRNALIAAQQIDVPRKVAQARTYVKAASTAAAAAGATPIPFSDAAILVPIQTGMMAKIAAIFGLGLSKGTFATLAGAAFTAGGVSQVGKYIVTSLLKFVPVAGQVAGGTIRAGVASALTYSVGEAWIAVCIQLNKLGAEDAAKLSPDEIKKMFLKEFKAKAKDAPTEE